MLAVVAYPAYKFRSTLGVADILGHAILWIILCFFTLGLGTFIYPYYLNRFLINHTDVCNLQDEVIGQLSCEFSFSEVLGNAIIWGLLAIVTFGLALLVWPHKTRMYCDQKTRVMFSKEMTIQQ